MTALSFGGLVENLCFHRIGSENRIQIMTYKQG